jgi:hypothetical protein
MRKRTILCLFIAVFFVKQLSAQNLITDPIQAAMDTMYSKLDTNYIPYKMLLEKAYLHSNLTYFDGILDSAADYTQVGAAAWDLPYMYCGNKFSNPNLRDTLENRISNYRIQNNSITPLVLLDYRFGTIDSMAFENNLLKFEGNYIKDVLPRTTSPYITDKALVFSPAINYGGSKQNFKFILRKKDYYTNYNKIVSSFYIDFSDGMGFRLVNFDQIINVAYSSYGRKNITIKVPIYLNGVLSTYYFAYSFIDLIYDNKPILTQEDLLDDCPKELESFWVTSDLVKENFNYAPGNRGLVTVSFGKDPVTGQKRTCIKKPIIFVEGIDFKTSQQAEEGYNEGFYRCNGMGFFDFYDQKELINGKYFKPISADHPFYMVKQMITELNDLGYDFIYLDFEKGADYMQKNALVVIKLIQKINQTKSKNGSCEPNIVVGASMGGQVVKYALSFMEKNNLEHDSKMYVSFDSPHLGANIPIGFQLMAKFFGTGPKNSLIGIMAYNNSRESIEHKLNRPGAKQLLAYHYETLSEHPLRTSFVNELNNMGDFPSETYNFGIVNGSGNMGITNLAGLGFTPGNELFKYEISVENTIDALFNLYKPKKKIGKKIKNFIYSVVSFPSFLVGAINPLINSPYQLSNFMYRSARATIYAAKDGKESFSYKPPYFHPTDELKIYTIGAPQLDHVAGCLRSDISESAVIFKNDWLNKGTQCVLNTFGHKFFCFMPTPSTMGWKTTDLKLAANFRMKDFVSDINEVSSMNYTKFNIISIPDTNEAHVRVTQKNKTDFIDRLIINNYLATNLNTIPNVNGSKFNHTQSQGNTMYLSTISNGGKYYINSTNLAGGYGQFQDPSYYYTNLNVYNQACKNVYLNDGSLLEVNSIQNQKSNLNIVSGTQLKLTGNSTLRINDNSTVRILKGAKLILSLGSTLEINGGSLIIDDEAIFENNGGVIKINGLNGNITFIGSLICNSNFSPILNKGFVLFMATKNLDNQIIANNFGINIKGLNRNDVIIKVKQKYLVLNGSSNIDIAFGTVVFEHEEAYITSNSKVNLKDLNVIQPNSLLSKSAMGFEIKYVSGSTFTNLDFVGLGRGLYVNNLTTVGLLVSNSKFISCIRGLVVDGGLLNLNTNEFNSNSYGATLNNILNTTSVKNNTFSANGYGLVLSGNSTNVVNLEKNNFNNNINGLLVAAGTNSVLRCNSFNNNSLAIGARYNCTLNLSKGYNTFNASTGPFILLENAKNIILNDGYNYFNTSEPTKCVNYGTCKYFITGTITSPNLCLINCNSNSYKNESIGLNHLNFNKLFNVTNTCGKVTFQEAGSVYWPINCGQFDGGNQSGLKMFETGSVNSQDNDEEENKILNCMRSKQIGQLNSKIDLELSNCLDLSFNSALFEDNNEVYETLASILPNPIKSNEALMINLPISVDRAVVEIFDMVGKEMFRGEISRLDNKIKLLDFSEGVYLIKINYDGKTDNEKIIVSN